MKILTPYISEKTVNLAKEGKFTLLVGKNLTKKEIKYLLKLYYKVDAVEVKIINKKNRKKKAAKGMKTKRGGKKLIVKLKEKQTIPGFEIIEEQKDEAKDKKPS